MEGTAQHLGINIFYSSRDPRVNGAFPLHPLKENMVFHYQQLEPGDTGKIKIPNGHCRHQEFPGFC